MSKTMFKDRTDADFYDKDCPAHKHLKSQAASLDVQGVLTTFYEESNVVIGGTSPTGDRL